MGRSKFPGKPTKHKKRVNVLSPTGELNGEVRIVNGGPTEANKSQDDEPAEKEGESAEAQTRKARSFRQSLTRKLNTTKMRMNGHQRKFIPKLCGKTHQLSGNGHNVRKDAAMLNFAGGKFVLPLRSVHSSRVIKPNKRFIELNESLSIKKKVLVKKRPIQQQMESGANTFDSSKKDNNNTALSNGHRVILRQPMLKLPNRIGTQGPFSMNLHNNGPGTIICGVCGAVRYYRFVKQARKFNIYSCESCRKFISKQIKRLNMSSGSSNVLLCLTGQGNCYVPPVERSQHWKILKSGCRSRCPACWLKMCLKSFHLPGMLKQNLTHLLPRNMRTIDFASGYNSLPPILWQRNNVDIVKRPLRFKSLSKPNQFSDFQSQSSDIKRQKVDLKGPRVKHVCRSASIVLGQPPAMFGIVDNNNSDNVKITRIASDSLNLDKSVETSAFLKDDMLCVKEDSSTVVTDDDISSIKGSLEKPAVHIKTEKIQRHPVVSIKQINRIPAPLINQKGIFLDYSHEQNLENRLKYGYSLNMTKETTVSSAMCFLCGSAGEEDMLVCCLCCEPYHTFCLLENYRSSIISDVDSNDWVCMKCKPCQRCNGFDRSKLSCSKCLKVYHDECFTSNDVNSYKLICDQCTKCHECGTSTAHSLSISLGIKSLCLNCLDKRKIGKLCPICQYSFEDNSACSKILECTKCQKWIHANCEKLTSEQYDILKLLPVASNFTCSKCLKDSATTWYRSVYNEMYSGFNQVFRLLIKNKMAKVILDTIDVRRDPSDKYPVLAKFVDMDNNNDSFNEKGQNIERSFSEKSLLDIKLGLCEYNSVKTFNEDMLRALKLYKSEQLIVIYKSIFQNVFFWFNEWHEKADNLRIPFGFNHLNKRISMLKLPKFLRGNFVDNRECSLCHLIGDKPSNHQSRLLYCDNTWVHANCAYWSTNVYERLDNHLQNVGYSINKFKHNRCAVCDKEGASIQCQLCPSTSYHFMCARKAQFYFTRPEKACYCLKHFPEKSESITDFTINRSLFIEYSSKELKFEPEKIHCQIGSLYVQSLGKIEPIVSDTSEAIIPTEYQCFRIFWSIKQPWTLVPYVIKTTIQNPNCTTLTVDKNFTIDHSQESKYINDVLKQLSDWRRGIYDKKIESLYSEEDDETEEEKNSSELLSPELTDTILEDLSHDILDGISVQDIFEDMMNLDNFAEPNKKQEPDELKSKGISPLNVTLSYRMDGAHPSSTSINRRRKISKDLSNSVLLLQVDGTFDDSLSESDCPLVVNHNICEEPVTCEKCHCTYRTQASYKRHLNSCEVICTSESDSENVPEHEELQMQISSQSMDISTVQVNEPVLVQSFESYQSQIHHTSLVNIPEPVLSQVQPNAINITEPTPMSLSVPLCVVQPQIEFQQPQPQMVLVQPPTPRYVPFVDSFAQASPAQSLQYVQVPQPQIQTQPQILQILPSIQPATTTVIVQQPQQLILDGSTTFGWAQQQPQIYYGFETIVQNTVMQSQQFLPTQVPGVITANSSYSTTTQVFQTSKLEPVLDVASNSFVLVNSAQLEIPKQQFPQTLIYSPSQPFVNQKSVAAPTQPNCISLPTAPFVSPNIPTNAVSPMTKPLTSHSRPMSRVLPMPTTTKKLKDEVTKIDDKLTFAKDLLSDSNVKINNSGKFEIMDYKIMKYQKKEGEFEPLEKLRKLSNNYEPLDKIEKAKSKDKIVTLNKKYSFSEKQNFFGKPKIECVPLKLNNTISAQLSTKNKLILKDGFDGLQKKKLENQNISVSTGAQKIEVTVMEIDKSMTTIQAIEKPISNSSCLEKKSLDMPRLEDIYCQPTNLVTPANNNNNNKLQVHPLLPVKPHLANVSKIVDVKAAKQPTPSKKVDSDFNGAPSILYTIENEEEGFKCSSTSISDCWSKLFEAVQSARATHNMPPLPFKGKQHIKSVQITGLKSSHIKYLVEQLPGASKCVKYKPLFKFTPSSQGSDVDMLRHHPFGAVRCQPHRSRNTEPYDIFSWLSSKHRQPFISVELQTVQSRRLNNFSMAMKFKNLKLTSKYSVGVYRSKIHGKGLFCLKDIEPGEMVIEYSGEVIRSILTDKREKMYNSKGIGCYMFRVDDNFVVDATMKGNAARFINHSCEPNCYSKVVEIMGHKHIIIFALRRIESGEELTYDYKFPFEEDKIPCTCGSKRCRKFLN